jgi:hypothetical protein
MADYTKHNEISLKNNPEYDEKWVQARISEDPSILKLGNLILKDSERRHAHAGRLDLLLRDEDDDIRYEVELQLGKTDESHIIRTIEYWDIERKRFPSFEHRAVIIAEDITQRFFNVISLFNGHIPLIAIKMQAIEIDGKVTLVFTKILDAIIQDYEDEEGISAEIVDRKFWERERVKTIPIVDSINELIKIVDNKLEIRYLRWYIGITENNRANNFVYAEHKANSMLFGFKTEETNEFNDKLTQAGFNYDHKNGYRIKSITKDEIDKNKELLIELIKAAYDQSR